MEMQEEIEKQRLIEETHNTKRVKLNEEAKVTSGEIGGG
jgi:hypothetical protein